MEEMTTTEYYKISFKESSFWKKIPQIPDITSLLAKILRIP